MIYRVIRISNDTPAITSTIYAGTDAVQARIEYLRLVPMDGNPGHDGRTYRTVLQTFEENPTDIKDETWV